METSVPPDALLHSFITKTLRVTTNDTRMFVGELKCTDRDANLILARTHEYRIPKFKLEDVGRKVDLTSRYLGLVVVMGVDISRIEVEEVGRGGAVGGGDDGMEV
ncbi:hypothetical protein TWF506_010601 [Arthrobotrys conoides]|uniref:Sm domain-containing protein n=1 Tax=Arthrobotrys conoides TaxID=74498 RepID=A0AAN8RSE7_9PEZI